MATKLLKDTWPSGLGPNDFECFGPAATEDDEFQGTKMTDMGCFKQPTPAEPDGSDTNKGYHGAVVKGSDSKWYAYFHWGRTGSRGAFQFVECFDENEADTEYIKQMKSKNTKRGEWVTRAGKRVLQAKAGKDCYLVRPLATRSSASFGLPNAAAVVSDDVKVKTVTKKTAKKKAAKPKITLDRPTTALMRALNVATVAYTKTSMQGGTIPTQASIDRARDLLVEAQKIVKKVGDKEAAQLKSKNLMDVTSEYYGRIPVVKPVKAPIDTWILGSNNISRLGLDLDAFESALKTTMSVEVEDVQGDTDPLGGIPIDISWVDPKSDNGKWMYRWMPRATKNVHGHRTMKIRNVWEVDRHGVRTKFDKLVDKISGKKNRFKDKALFQPTDPPLTAALAKKYKAANVAWLFHGTKSVNVSGIMREGLRLPRQLVGVAITGAMFGSGNYFADDWGKAANYCSGGNSYWAGGQGHIKSRGNFMFVSEVALGKAFVADSWGGYKGPPSGYDCIFGKAGHSGVQNNEWVSFEFDQNQMQFLVEFDC